MIGYGFMGKAHSNAWRQAPHFFPLKAKVEMHTICGRDRARVESARGQLGWQQSATDWQEVVESPLIDVVDICTSNVTHTEIALAAARAGKHVMCEKPLALNVADAEKIVKADLPPAEAAANVALLKQILSRKEKENARAEVAKMPIAAAGRAD